MSDEFFHAPSLIDTLTAAQSFVDWMNSQSNDRDDTKYVPIGYHFELDRPGKRFVRIVMCSPSRSVHAFVDLATGDLLKAAGWKAPAKGARGNILTDQESVRARWDWSGHYLYR